MSQADIKPPAKFELRRLGDLKNWNNNPRSITKTDLGRLEGQINKLGLYKTLLVNQDNIVLGGNQRLTTLLKMYGEDHEIMCGIVETSSESEMLEYALSDNDAVGTTNTVKLAELHQLTPIGNPELYKVVTAPLRPLDEVVTQKPTGSSSSSESGSAIGKKPKQLVLRYDSPGYTQAVTKLEAIGKHLSLTNNTDIITHLINAQYEEISPTA